MRDHRACGAGGPVKREGQELLWQCPNHDDAHPSFRINAQKNVFACFPCDVKGTPMATRSIPRED